ncbi:MAG: hypothetical protein R8K46_00360 [Mariprofundaceae bacterium]
MTDEQQGQTAGNGDPPRPQRKLLKANCSTDPDHIATFYCARCNKAFCEDCVGREAGKQTYCLQCAAVAEGQQDAVGSKSGVVRKVKWALATLAGTAAIITCFNLYILYTGRPEASGNVIKPPMSAQLSSLATCRHRLEQLVQQASYYQKATGSVPTQLTDLETMVDDKQMLIDPVSKARYRLSHDKKTGITVSCPHPEKHGLAELYARPGKPAIMVYANKGGGG